MTPPFSTLADFERTRDFGQKISAVFDFLRAHIRPLLRCLVQYALLVPLIGFILAGLAQKVFFTDYHPTGLNAIALASSAPATLLSYIPLAIGHVLLILTVYGYVLTRLDTPPTEPVDTARVGTFVRTRFLSTFGASLLLLVLTVVAFAFLVIPGVWLSVAATPFFFVLLREKLRFRDALTRSTELVNGHWWETLGLIIVVGIIQNVLPTVVTLIGGALLGVGAVLIGAQDTDYSIMTYIWVAVSNLLSLLMYTMLQLAVMFQYFHLVELKEGRGVRSLLDQLGQPAAATAAHHYRADEEGEY